MADLSILIPARNEQFLAQTIDNIIENIQGDTEIIAVCDGNWPSPPVQDRPNVHLIYHPESIGQRQAVNEAARISTSKYIMKLDAHCAVAPGFDVVLMADCEPDWTVVPRMFNLHAFDWQCGACGYRTYQGPQPERCKNCDSDDGFEQVIVWRPRWSRKTDFARFDATLRFQYWGAYGKRLGGQGEIADTMCFVGAAFFMERARYWELGGLDERHGSWGQMGVEISCKSWLSGGRQVTNKKTWFAHMFRTQSGFGFPYPNSGSAVEQARQHSRWLWLGGNWEGATHPLSWLIDKFSPVPDWGEQIKSEPAKGVVFYTDNRLDDTKVGQAARSQLKTALNGHELITVSLSPIRFGQNISLDLERGYLTMFKQILAGLEASTADVVFLCEHDVLYHPTHFDFTPPRSDVFYYNENVWKIRLDDGHALFYYVQQTSGLCAYRSLLLEHYRRRVAICEDNLKNGLHADKQGFTRRMGFEPGTHGRKERVDDYQAESWMSEYPNLDIRHDKNLTPSRWSQGEFRNKRYCSGWIEKDRVPGWGKTLGQVDQILDGVINANRTS